MRENATHRSVGLVDAMPRTVVGPSDREAVAVPFVWRDRRERMRARSDDWYTASRASSFTDRPSTAPSRGYVAKMQPKATTLLAEIQKLADPAGLVSELPLFDVTDGSSEELKDLLEVLEEAGFVQREASDCVRLTARGIAAAHGAG